MSINTTQLMKIQLRRISESTNVMQVLNEFASSSRQYMSGSDDLFMLMQASEEKINQLKMKEKK